VPLEGGDHLANNRSILCEGDGVERIERFYDGDEIALTKLYVDKTQQRVVRARRGLAGVHVEFVEQDAEDTRTV